MKFARRLLVSVMCLMLAASVALGAAKADFESALAKAKRGDAEAQVMVGYMYVQGDGVKKDEKKAIEWLEKAAAQNNGDALGFLGAVYYFSDNDDVVKQDKKKGREYLEKGAALNNGFALGLLGMVYYSGEGVKQDYKKARKYFERAAALQNGNGLGLIGLALMYSVGQGVSENYNKAIKYVEAYLDQDIEKYSILDTIGDNSLYAYALKLFALIVAEKGEDIQLGEKKFLKYLKKGAELSDIGCLLRLGRIYEEGRSDDSLNTIVRVNYQEALKYYTKGAELGNEDCMMSLGRFYENGLGVTKDINKAVEYYRQAAEKGSEQAKKALARLNVPLKAPVQPKPSKQAKAPTTNKLGLINSSLQNKPRLAIFKFTDKSEEGKAPADAIINMMETELHQAGVFRLLNREHLNYILEEQKLGQSGLVDPSTAPTAGRIAGAQYALTGAITLYYYSEKASGFAIPILGSSTKAKTAYVVLDIKITDVETSEILYASSQVGEATQKDKTSPGSYSKMIGGLLSMAMRDSVAKHISAIKAKTWEM